MRRTVVVLRPRMSRVRVKYGLGRFGTRHRQCRDAYHDAFLPVLLVGRNHGPKPAQSVALSSQQLFLRGAKPRAVPRMWLRHMCAGCGPGVPRSAAPPPAVAQPPQRAEPASTVPQVLDAYARLAKWRLGALVLSTTMMGFLVAPGPFAVIPFLSSSVGTAMCISAANTINQITEVPHDSLMLRTRSRVLPTERLTARHATAFATTCAVGGVGLLWAGCNPLAAALAGANILLYAYVYTPLKRVGPSNTYVGAIVGALPPLIGWVACDVASVGQAAAWVLPALLFSWQMPHFLALSHMLRDDYARGGYKMRINVDPDLVPLECLAWSVAVAGIGVGAAAAGLTSWWFALDAALVQGAGVAWPSLAFWRAHRSGQDQGPAAKRVFRATLWSLPVLMLLMAFHRREKPKVTAEAGGNE